MSADKSFWGVRELAIHRRVSRLRYSPRCAETSAMQAHLRQGIPLAPGMEIGYVVRDARKWEADQEKTANGFDAGYYRKLLGKAWEEAAFVFGEEASGRREVETREPRRQSIEYEVELSFSGQSPIITLQHNFINTILG